MTADQATDMVAAAAAPYVPALSMTKFGDNIPPTKSHAERYAFAIRNAFPIGPSSSHLPAVFAATPSIESSADPVLTEEDYCDLPCFDAHCPDNARIPCRSASPCKSAPCSIRACSEPCVFPPCEADACEHEQTACDSPDCGLPDCTTGIQNSA